jgi:Zn-dependent peptidase ImmA (M78 family)
VRVDIVGQFRRKLPQDRVDHEGTEAVQLLHDLAAAYVELERRLNRVTVTDYPPETRLGRGRLDQQAEEVAAELRSRLGLGLGPVPNLTALLELQLGVRVFARPLPSSISGVYAYHEELGACILVNQSHRWTRRRWSLSHELAHFMTTRREPSVAYSRRGQKHPDDMFADCFAAAFLMPSATVRRMFNHYVGEEQRFSSRHLILGAHRLGVSVEAFARRLERLELLPSGTFDSLRDRGLDRAAVKQVLGMDFERGGEEPNARLLLLAAEAYEKDLFSEGQLADMLALDRVTLREVVDDLAGLDEALPMFAEVLAQ